jgi:hypothetical protein
VDEQQQQVGPLRTIIRRALLHSNNPKQDQAIITGCANWITSILLGPACNLQATRGKNNKVAHSATMKKAVGELLRRGRGCVSQLNSLDSSEGLSSPEEFANVVSGSILELLQRAAKEKQRHERPSSPRGSNADPNKQFSIACSSQAQAQLLVKQAEEDIAILSAKLANKKQQMNGIQQINSTSRRMKNNVSAAANSVIVDLMSRRDRSKQIADKSGNVVEISVYCKKRFDEASDTKEESIACSEEEAKTDGGDQIQQPSGHFQSNEDKNSLMTKCLGPILQLSVKTSVAETTSLENKLEVLANQSSLEKDELTTRQSTIVTKRQEISSRMEQIRRELEELARQDAQLATEEKELDDELDRLVRKSDKEIAGLKSKIDGKANHVTLDKELRRAVDKLGELELAWIRSSSSISSSSVPPDNETSVLSSAAKNGPSTSEVTNEPDPSLPTALPTKLTSYLHRARSYFQSEATCVEFLRNRVSADEAKVLDLEREIEAFSNLGLENNVENMRNRLVVLKSHVDEDNLVIDSLRKDAKGMREDLIRRVEEYYAVMDGADENKQDILDAIQIAALEGISIDLTGIGFYDDSDGGLGAIFSKIPKQVSRVTSPTNTNTGSEIDCDGSTSYIGDIDTAPAVKTNGAANKPPALVAAPANKMPKFSWASNTTAAPKKEAKSLLEIQQEEMAAAAKATNGNA